ncbi:hypothetical protein ACFX1T_007503 [Malus domestica]
MAFAWASSSTITAVVVSLHSQKGGSSLTVTKASFFGERKLRVRSFTSTIGSSSSLTVRAAAADHDRLMWFSGSTHSPWLDGSLPGDFGFDHFGLSSDPDSLKWNQQAELIHCRWAMLSVAGIFIPESSVFWVVEEWDIGMVIAKSNISSETSTGLCNCYKVASLTSSILDADETSNLKDQYILGEQSDLLFALSLADSLTDADMGFGQGGSAW